MYLKTSIFPSLDGSKWALVNLNDWAMDRMFDTESNKLYSDPDFCDSQIRILAVEYNAQYIAGGWMEDRSTLWKDSYIEKPNSIHLGFDLQAPVRTPVSVPSKCIVYNIWNDPDQAAGWGTRVIFQLFDSYDGTDWLIYGHLDGDITVQITDVVEPGQIIGYLANSQYNGGWFPHLHIQCATTEAISIYKNNLNQLDGYGSIEDTKLYRDPINLIGHTEE